MMAQSQTLQIKLSVHYEHKDLDVAALNFDTLEYVKQLTDAGVERQVAEIHAITVGRAMGMYVNNLVTQEYLDATLDARFAQQDARIEQRFNALERQVEVRVAPLELAIQSIQVTQRFQSGLLLILVGGLLVPPVLSLVKSLA
jgi:hypothetical protein